MKSTLANLWHPVRGVQIRDLGEKRYLFQFFHFMDLDRVLKGSPWTFNNHLLLLYKLQLREDPLQVPLVLTPFWVQIHDVPVGLFSENLVIQIGNFIGVFLEYDGYNLGKENRTFMRIRVQIDVRHPLKRKKQILFCWRRSYVNFKYERLSLFCFYCGRLGHNDSFCEAKMMLGVEAADMGWDLTLRAQSRRARDMNSIWLREVGDDKVDGNDSNGLLGHEIWRAKNRKSCGRKVDPILVFNIEGESSTFGEMLKRVWPGQIHTSMDHDMEDTVLIGEEGKKKSRVEEDEPIGSNVSSSWRLNYAEFRWREYEGVVVLYMVSKWMRKDREDSWATLKNLFHANDIPWIVAGDLNEIMYGFKKKGGLPREENRMEAFQKALEDCQLHDIGFSRRWFTWKRGNLPETNIQERLDRGVANTTWMFLFPEEKIQHLVHSFSDHCPLLIVTKKEVERRKENCFKFEAWWTFEDSFDDEVKRLWGMIEGNFLQKMDLLRKGLQKWARQILKK
ncbi:hypothetical protein CXB51_005801 [Gossypium anomalum]|uniref:CCHC-type domain-containing protein n=1 Tax=Gossypium anomalum TaxID=47600 RepID=A0A8J5ZE55_9ROSI|nr:hypothetical protein CXB51_005801 [Gossypium anomalum]